MIKVYLTALILSAAGIAGAIEEGRGLVASLILLAVALMGITREAVKEEDEKRRKSRIDNDASYPCYLKK